MTTILYFILTQRQIYEKEHNTDGKPNEHHQLHAKINTFYFASNSQTWNKHCLIKLLFKRNRFHNGLSRYNGLHEVGQTSKPQYEGCPKKPNY